MFHDVGYLIIEKRDKYMKSFLRLMQLLSVQNVASLKSTASVAYPMHYILLKTLLRKIETGGNQRTIRR